jgi:hypothetical protein
MPWPINRAQLQELSRRLAQDHLFLPHVRWQGRRYRPRLRWSRRRFWWPQRISEDFGAGRYVHRLWWGPLLLTILADNQRGAS